MNPNFKNYLLKLTKASDCSEVEVIQTLWSGYGSIIRYQLNGSEFGTVVVKCIAPNDDSDHPRGWNTSFSHQRKLKSYEVELNWYRHWSQLTHNSCKIPDFLGSFSEGHQQWIVMEDLNANFPTIKTHVNLSEVKVCLKWLANFHTQFLKQKPNGLWKIGTYWHLETRPDEFEKIENKDLKGKAHVIDDLLNNCQFQTIVHGDAKLANFCFSENGENVAAVDFQYVGGGCGMKDVAYFLGSCLSGPDCEQHENELLDYYFLELKQGLVSHKNSVDFTALEKDWRQMYPIASADFTRFLLGWMPNHQKINAYSLKMLDSVLCNC